MSGFASQLGEKKDDDPFLVENRACTMNVQTMHNPETGEETQATNGCQIQDLKDAGWVVGPAPDKGITEDQSEKKTASIVDSQLAVGLLAAGALWYSLRG